MQQIQHWLEQHCTDGVHLNSRELVAYRSQTPLLDLTPQKAIQAKLAGAYLAKTKGRGMEFDEARHYQPGDDIRAIDWRVTARTGKTHTKLYREEKERPVFVLTDLSASMHFGTQFMYKSVQAAHLTALIAWAAKKRGDRIGGLIVNQDDYKELKPKTTKKAVLGLIHGLLAMHRPDSDVPQQTSFAEACARLRRIARPGSLVFIISDFRGLDEVAKQHLSRISRHCELTAYMVSDPLEHHLPRVMVPQQVALTDGQRTQSIMLGEKRTEQEYAHRYQARQNAIKQTLRQCRSQIMPISCAEPLARQLGGRR
ncbi:uncharacterized protein HMF8227_01924 [Saliniradius amylolyticus]|uniref:DUF58 domain-containing protein n=1 Tax=Saliniradius amylolyticus TaxID=2183582 RepID=A0A2S2E425_9ALTE|nr:DUF58 domain-containing protein [Saliniradius amylolyticus]AWL12394.1 uncharacterized protein HMF8227_01924 [Saliniradius amylolyticus]